MTVPVCRVARFVRIGSVDQITLMEQRAQSFLFYESSGEKTHPYAIVVRGDEEQMLQIQRLFTEANYENKSNDVLCILGWNPEHKHDAEQFYKALVSLGTVSVYLFAKAEHAHEFGLSFIVPKT
ncbi:hypothetical protein BH11PAT2_BH11PAT2_05870 [soil metagenome]